MTLALTLPLAIANIIIVSSIINNNIPRSSWLISAQSIRSNVGTRHCDGEICDSLVSKCTLTNRCICNFRTDAHCAKACIDCLEEKFGKCCACVGLCPVITSDLYSSHVGDTSASDRQLFEVLTETDDIRGRWRVKTQSTGIQVSHPKHGSVEYAYRITGANSSAISHDNNLEKLKCTVAYINRHLSMTKCKKSCTSMGAHFFGWFHDGCCECIGEYCLNYGFDEPGCLMPEFD